MERETIVRPMDHQLEAIEKLRNGSILCGGVGTGKSFTSLLYFALMECGCVQWAKDDGAIGLGPMLSPRDLYIITTARKRDTHEWLDECSRFDFSQISVTVDSWNNIHKYSNVSNAFFIFDEQRIVGSGTWVREFYRIAKGNRWILLTATPGDTWMDYIPVFIANGFYKNRTQFLRRHAVYNRYSKYPKVDKWLEPGVLESLRRKITVIMKYKKKTVPHWADIWVPYDEKLYKTIFEKRWDPWKEEPIRDISGACYLMRRATNENVNRIISVLDILRDRHRAILFYNYDYELALIREYMKDRGYGFAEWNGHIHEPLPEGESWIYVVQYAAGCEGWNCVTTDTIIFFSQSYSYKQMTQAAGRIDRLNTPYTDLYYYVLKSKAPIDAAIGRALKGKRNFNEKLFMERGQGGWKHVDGDSGAVEPKRTGGARRRIG